MAIINVTQKNFSKLASENLDSIGSAGFFATALLGGKDKLKEALSATPDEQLLWVNTEHVSAVSAPIKVLETGEVVFRIHFRYPEGKDNAILAKAEDYERFILAWAGEERWLVEGEYKVTEGYRAISCDNGTKVKVEKA